MDQRADGITSLHSGHSYLAIASFSAAVVVLVVLAAPRVKAQNPQLQDRVAEIKEGIAANKQSLAKYTWQEQQTISIKGNTKKKNVFEVRMGPDGKPQKTELSSNPSSSGSGGGPLKRHVVAKKKKEFEKYAQQIAALAQSYAEPDPQRLQQAYLQGNVSLGSTVTPGELKLMITNYIKPNDSVAIVFNREAKAIQSLEISSYLDEPKDAVTISAQFSKLRDGTTHVSSMTMNGVSRHLTVQTQNSNYQLSAFWIFSSKDGQAVKLTVRLLAHSIPVPYSSFGLIEDNYLAEIYEGSLQARLVKVSYRFLIYQTELPQKLSSGKMFTVTARRDSYCDATYEAFATRYIFDRRGNFLRTSDGLLPLNRSVMPEAPTDLPLPCFWFAESDLNSIVMK